MNTTYNRENIIRFTLTYNTTATIKKHTLYIQQNGLEKRSLSLYTTVRNDEITVVTEHILHIAGHTKQK